MLASITFICIHNLSYLLYTQVFFRDLFYLKILSHILKNIMICINILNKITVYIFLFSHSLYYYLSDLKIISNYILIKILIL